MRNGDESNKASPSEADIVLARDTAFNVARYRNLSPHDAEDLAQTVAERLLHQPAVPDNVAAWSTTVAKNLVVDLMRKRKAGSEGDTWVAREVGLDAEVVDDLLGLSMFVQRRLATSDIGTRARVVGEILEVLGTVLSQREVQLLVLLSQGRSQAEIADELGYKNAQTVKATLARARKKAAEVAEHFTGFRDHPRVY